MKMEDVVNYAKQYGFVFQGSEIYGGLSNTWDYGPIGKELKENNYISKEEDLSCYFKIISSCEEIKKLL